MTDELTIATFVLAGWTATLALATIAYAYYVRKQTILMKVQENLTRIQQALISKQIAVAALTIPPVSGGDKVRTIQGYDVKAKMIELGLPEAPPIESKKKKT